MKSALLRALGPAALVLAIALTGCGAEETDNPSAGNGSTPTATSPMSSPTEVTPVDPSTSSPDPGQPSGAATSDPKVQAAIQDLAAHLDIADSDITVVTFEQVTWSDGSIGCPQPGHMYSQALVEGTRLVLSAQGREYAYHAGGDSPLTRCENPQRPAGTRSTS